MSQRRAVRLFCAALAIVTSSAAGGTAPAAAGQQDAEALLTRLRDLLAQTEAKRMVVPFPNSRSRILVVDGNADLFLYMERGNIRGSETIDNFYEALNAGDFNGAYQIFEQSSLVSMRVSDFGWNGLGVPMIVEESGAEIQDRFFRNVEGVFGAAEVTPEDVATYLEYIENLLIPALEGA